MSASTRSLWRERKGLPRRDASPGSGGWHRRIKKTGGPWGRRSFRECTTAISGRLRPPAAAGEPETNQRAAEQGEAGRFRNRGATGDTGDTRLLVTRVVRTGGQ